MSPTDQNILMRHDSRDDNVLFVIVSAVRPGIIVSDRSAVSEADTAWKTESRYTLWMSQFIVVTRKCELNSVSPFPTLFRDVLLVQQYNFVCITHTYRPFAV